MDKESRNGLILAIAISIPFGWAMYSIAHKNTHEPIIEECKQAEFIHITHRDGFFYCYDNDTVSWVSNFQQQDWKPATIIEKRRAHNQTK